MLQLQGVRKSYTTSGFTQTALDGVSIAFRDSEFAAVLGPSGSGKTTMLNIIGGLDQYDSGDLVIDDISTENYRSRDWDTYRNNRIGFVFQSYNLIPHQSVLSNVELALTLSGVSKAERRMRAKKALDSVGLLEHIRKKPSQLSGGQMQRVAIARALINDPEILLADEPTGALDTTTSRQVMELLTVIAKDRLVIMVTHNNALAERYANRIINLTDGKVTADSNPFDPLQEEWRAGRKARRASMSFLTAIMLSFSNLMTKKARTIITAFAGSIGIIGIAAIFSLSNGINAYIKSLEEDTLSIYPLSIMNTGLDFSGILSDAENARHSENFEENAEGVRELRIIETVFSRQNKNDLASLKSYFDENSETLDEYINSIHYIYDVAPQIFLADTSKGADQVNPDSIFGTSMMGSSGGFGYQSGFGGMSGMNVFSEMPGDLKLYENQYEVLKGRWPKSFDEAVLVLAPGARISDFALYAMGIRDRSELKSMLEAFMNRTENSVAIGGKSGLYSYDTLMSASFVVIHPTDVYQYDEIYDVWVDKSGDKAFMKSLVDNGVALKIVGIVKPDSSASATSLSIGINYTPALVKYLMEHAAGIKVVQDQLNNPDVNVLTGKTFAEEQEKSESEFDFSKIISVDEDVFRDAFAFDLSFPTFDLGDMDFSNLDLSEFDSGSFDFGGISLEMPDADMPTFDIAVLLQAIIANVEIPTEELMTVMAEILQDYFISQISQGITDPNQIMANLPAYLSDPEVQAMIMYKLSQIIDMDELQGQISEVIAAYMMSAMQTYMTQMMEAIQLQIQNAMLSAMGQVSAQMKSAMQNVTTQLQQGMQKSLGQLPAQIESAMKDVDGSALAEAFQIELGEEELLEIMMSVMNQTESTYERNLSLFGYADEAVPSQINLYPKDFEAKQETLNILNSYNDRMEESGESDKVIHFTDLVGVMMSTFTDMIDMVSYALVAFVAVSLVVSSIMIGVITFISVLERKKEIGILRAIGASKQNIRLVFNAEALIIGFVAGILGVLVTIVIIFFANIIINNKLGIAQLVLMPPQLPVVLVAISMFLTFIAGLFPSSAAARRAPVEALRSE